MWGIGEAFCQWLIHNKHLVFFVHQHLCIGIYCCLRETSTTLTTPKTSRIIVNEHQAKSQNLKLKFRQKPNATSPPVHHLQPVLEIGVPSSSRSTLNKSNFLISKSLIFLFNLKGVGNGYSTSDTATNLLKSDSFFVRSAREGNIKNV